MLSVGIRTAGLTFSIMFSSSYNSAFVLSFRLFLLFCSCLSMGRATWMHVYSWEYPTILTKNWVCVWSIDVYNLASNSISKATNEQQTNQQLLYSCFALNAVVPFSHLPPKTVDTKHLVESPQILPNDFSMLENREDQMHIFLVKLKFFCIDVCWCESFVKNEKSLCLFKACTQH
jgi:hypothetical protein